MVAIAMEYRYPEREFIASIRNYFSDFVEKVVKITDEYLSQKIDKVEDFQSVYYLSRNYRKIGMYENNPKQQLVFIYRTLNQIRKFQERFSGLKENLGEASTDIDMWSTALQKLIIDMLKRRGIQERNAIRRIDDDTNFEIIFRT